MSSRRGTGLWCSLRGLGGLREGELFALRRSDLDLGRGLVKMRRKRLRLASGEVIEGDPKSRAGRRDVYLPVPVVEELEAHLDRLVEPEPEAFVFTSPRGTPLERSNFRYRVWEPATETVGLAGLRFHDTRHTAGTLAAQTGATTKELMARLGHSSSRAAMMYRHASDERDRRIAERLAEMVGEQGSRPQPRAARACLGHETPVGVDGAGAPSAANPL